MTRRLAAATLTVLALSGCGDPLGPTTGEDLVVEVSVSGGFAGVSYSYELDGAEGVIRGLTCSSGCSFEPGDILFSISPAQARRTADEMRAAGILGLDGVDFGTQCCDQFAYVVQYDEGEQSSTVRGDAGTFPPLLLRSIDRLTGAADGRLPVIVALESGRDAFPQDPLTILEVERAGALLTASLQYSGGCARHEIDLVAYGGFLESAPVQVDVFLSHEDNDDACDAVLTEARGFDLSPLADAYREAYGSGAPGATTLILRLRDPDQPGEVRLVEYRF